MKREKIFTIYTMTIALVGIVIPLLYVILKKPPFPPVLDYTAFFIVAAVAAVLYIQVENTIVSFEIAIFYFLTLVFGPYTGSFTAMIVILIVWIFKAIYFHFKEKISIVSVLQSGAFNAGLYGIIFLIGGVTYISLYPAKYAYVASIFAIILSNEIIFMLKSLIEGENIKKYILEEALLSDILEMCIYPLGISMAFLYSDYGLSSLSPLLIAILLLSYMGKSMSDFQIKLSRRIKEESELNKIARALGGILDPGVLVKKILEETLRFTRAKKVIFIPMRRLPCLRKAIMYDGVNFTSLTKGEAKKLPYTLALEVKSGGAFYAEILVDTPSPISKEEMILANNLIEIISKSLNNAILYKESIVDGLTGLYTRRYFENRLKEEIKRSDRYGDIFSLVMFDLDNFKYINDAFGHLIGDKALQQFAKCIKRILRKSDLAARWGGDEFVVILPGAKEEEALEIGKRLEKELKNNPVVHKDQKIVIDVSFASVTYTPSSRLKAKDLFHKVDALLLKEKQKKGNRQITPEDN